MSTTVDVSDSLDEARTRLLKTARALNGAWAAALCSMGSLVVGEPGAAAGRDHHPAGVRRHLVGAAGGDRLQPDPVLAAPPPSGAACCSAEPEARRPAGVPSTRTAGWRWPDVGPAGPAGRARAGRGRAGARAAAAGLPRPRPSSASCCRGRGPGLGRGRAGGPVGAPGRARRHRPAAGRPSAAADLADAAAHRDAPRPRRRSCDADLGNWAGACERAAVRPSARVRVRRRMSSRDQVAEAWAAAAASSGCEPAFARGRRHLAPFTGAAPLRRGCGRRRLAEAARGRGGRSTGAIARIVAPHEDAVALELDERGDRLQPITWEQHPRRGHRAALAGAGHRGAGRRAPDDVRPGGDARRPCWRSWSPARAACSPTPPRSTGG